MSDKPDRDRKIGADAANYVMSHLEFRRLIAQYKRAVYTNWIATSLTDRRQGIQGLLDQL